MKIASLALIVAAIFAITAGRFITSDTISASLSGLGVSCGFIAGYLDAKAEA